MSIEEIEETYRVHKELAPSQIEWMIDHVKRMEACIKKEIKRCGSWREGRIALKQE